jgi:hypothetical protein
MNTRRVLLVIFAHFVLSSCGYQTTTERWAATGHPVPDLYCHAYLDVSYNPEVLIYLYFREPYSGRVLMPSGEIINATYELQGTSRHWMWGADPRANTYAYDIMVNANGHGYYYDFAMYPSGQTVAKREDYMCKRMQ